MDGGARGKGSGHMMGRWYPAPEPPAVHPNGPGLRRSGAKPWRRSQPPAGGADRDRAAAGQDDAAAEKRVSVAGVVFPHRRAVVLAAAINRPAKSRSAGSRSAATAGSAFGR